MSTTLTAPETREFAKHEATIDAGLTGFVAVGNALAAIRDKRLYRVDHKTFDAYCRDRWKIAKSRAYQLIAAATTVDGMSTVVDELPTTERQVRPLARLPEEQRAEAWQAAVEAEPSGPTAEAVEAIVDARLNLSEELELAGDPLVFTCQVCGGTELTTDEDGTFCARCKDPIGDKADANVAAEPARKPKNSEQRSTIIDRCQAFWDGLTATERIIAAGWFNDQLGYASPEDSSAPIRANVR